jgi:hypothetical protein
MPRYAAILFSLLLGLSACCPLTSEQPLSEPQQAAYDQRLAGTWKSEGEAAYFHIGRGQGGRIQVLAVEHGNSGKFDYALFNVFATPIKTQAYLNVDLSELSRKITMDHKGYIFVRYDLPDPDTVIIYAMNLETLVEAIQAKKIAGELTFSDNKTQKGKPKVECARITDSPEKLRAFLSDESLAKKLFSHPITMKRVK